MQPFHSHHTRNLSNLTFPNHSSCDVLTIFIVCCYLKQASESLRRRKIMQLNVKRINVEWIRKIISSLSFNRKFMCIIFFRFSPPSENHLAAMIFIRSSLCIKKHAFYSFFVNEKKSCSWNWIKFKSGAAEWKEIYFNLFLYFPKSMTMKKNHDNSP